MTAMPEHVFNKHPRLYRWLFRLLPFAAVLTIFLFGVAGWAVVDGVAHNRKRSNSLQVQAVTLRQQTEALKQQNARQAVLIAELRATTRLLCDRGYIIIGLVEAAIDSVSLQLRDDVATGRASAVEGDRQFLRSFRSYHSVLVAQTINPKSPCVQTR